MVKKDLNWWMIAVVALGMGAIVGQVWVSQTIVPSAVEEFPDEGTGGSRYPEDLRESFMEGCVSSTEQNVGRSDGTRICLCMVEKLEAAYSMEDFMLILSRIQGEALPPQLQSLLSDCLADVNSD